MQWEDVGRACLDHCATSTRASPGRSRFWPGWGQRSHAAEPGKATPLESMEMLGETAKVQIPSDLVVRYQVVDIFEVIFSLIWRGTIV